MTIIDRYVLRQFVRVFVICFASLAGLYVVFDVFSNLDEFQRYAERHGRLFASIFGFYSYRLVYFFDRTAGVLVLIAAMFTIAWIKRYHELTALMAAGISRVRVIRPVVAAAAVVSLLAAANREIVIPRIGAELSRNPKDLLGEVAQSFKPRYDPQTGILFQGANTYANEQRIHKPDLLLPAGLDSLGKRIKGSDAYYRAPEAGRSGGYLIRGVTQPPRLLTGPSLARQDAAVVITPPDAPDWLQADECFVVSDLTFDQLRGAQGSRQFSSTRDLIRGLSNTNLGFGADVRVTIHSRIVQPLLDMTLLFLGLPILLARESRHVFASIGVCAAIVAGFLMVVLGFQYLGTIYYLAPARAAWFPLVIFVPIAAGLFDRMQR